MCRISLRQYGLMGVVWLWSLNGHAVTTAMLDTGIAPGVLVKVKVPGYDYINNDPVAEDQSEIRHGTQMAQIFNSVTRGTELIMPLKTWKPYVRAWTNAAMMKVNSDASVRVVTLNTLQPVNAPLLVEAAGKDKVVVINAGNDGNVRPLGTARHVPSLGGGGMIVGSLGSNGQIASSSNRAGDLKEYSITAPGSSPYSSIFGNSFASARVAGGAAVLRTRDPHLSNAQIVEILFNTADDKGAPGVDNVYGHGRMNLTKAMQPQGTPTAATGGSSSSGGSGVVAGALLIGAGTYALTQHNSALENALVLDEYGRSFHLDLTRQVTRRPLASMTGLFAALDDQSGRMLVSQTLERQVFATVQLDPARARLHSRRFGESSLYDNAWDYEPEAVRLTLQAYEASGSHHAMGLNAAQTHYFGALSLVSDRPGQGHPEQGRTERPRFLHSEAFTTPFMGFTEQGLSSVSTLRYGERVSLSFGLSALDDAARHGRQSESVVFQTRYRTDQWGLSVQLGQLLEHGNLYGGASNGAFSVDAASTLSLGLAGEYRLGARSSLIGSYTLGVTEVNDRKNSLLHNFSTLRSDSWGLGVITRGLWKNHDALGVAVLQPLRVRHGEVDTDVPVKRDIAGNIYKHHRRSSLAPDGSETVLEMYYKFNLSKRSELASHLFYRDQPYHDRDAPSVRAVMFTYQRFGR